MPAIRFAVCFFLIVQFAGLPAQTPSLAREWNEAVLQTIREDLARPHVQARNLFHFSVALYDAWAVYDSVAQPYLLGKSVGGFSCPCKDIPKPPDVEAARREAMSHAAYRLLTARYSGSPRGAGASARFQELMKKHGYNIRDNNTDYRAGSPAALGNYLAQCLLQMGMADGANEVANYLDPSYKPVNPPLDITVPGTPGLVDPNAWQPLKLTVAIDQDGHQMVECAKCGVHLADYIGGKGPDGRMITSTQTFNGAQWGRVRPFALRPEDRVVHRRGGQEFPVYHDPGAAAFPRFNDSLGTAGEYGWNVAAVAAAAALLDATNDATRWDVSPRGMGNVQHYPQTLAELHDFYNVKTGRDPGAGRKLNPRTGQPYEPVTVVRGDFARVAARYWAEGPNGETAAGHWFALLNYVNDQPGLLKKFNGQGPVMSDLEWDVKAYFTLGAALHDAAIATWSNKAWYNGVRPITAVRFLAARGQRTDRKLPSYHPAGIELVPGRIEVVQKGDALAGPKNENVGKIKIFSWKGPFAATNPATESAGVGWVLAENWFPYQIKAFVNPPVAGYVSEHAVLARAAAESLALLTGDEFFPGGLGEFTVKANSEFLRVDKDPATDIRLQWATYRDAADQASLSQIWAGAIMPADDVSGRLMGVKVGLASFEKVKEYFKGSGQ